MNIGLAYGLLATFSFALSPVFYSIGSKGLSPIEANSIRALLSFPMTYMLYLGATGNATPYPGVEALLWSIILCIAANIIGDTLFLATIKYLGPSTGLAVSNIFPLFSITFAVIFLREEVSLYSLIGVLLVILGIFYMYFSLGGLLDARKGVLLGILTALAWGIAIMLMKPASEKIPIMDLVLFRNLFLLLLLSPIIIKTLSKTSKTNLAGLGIGGFFGIILGFLGVLGAVKYLGVTAGSIMASAAPVLTPLFSQIMVRENITIRTVTSIVLTTAGIITVIYFSG